MRTAPALTLTVSAALVAGVSAALRAGAVPLGVRGEWEWLRLPVRPLALDVGLAAVGVLGYALVAGLGMAALRARATPGRETLAVLALLAASIVAQTVAQTGAPAGYGLDRWVLVLHDRGSNGYFTVARDEATDLRGFLAGYPAWIKRQDSLHIGTHPPGLIVVDAVLLRAMRGSPVLARGVMNSVPESVARAFRVHGQTFPMAMADRATLALAGLLTAIACGATVVPLYWLARASLPASAAWSAAALWPLVPSSVLFQPAPDTAFPLLSTTALALAVHANGRRRRRAAFPVLAGLTLGVGMQFTLAFLAVGLIVGIVAATDREASARAKGAAILAVGLGFLGFTLAVWATARANPFVVWWWNQTNHARFYAEYPRSYRAWVVANPIELFLALGIPASTWALLGFVRWPRDVPRVSVTTALVLVFLTLSGRTLSEVARLWLPFFPALLVASGLALHRSGAGPRSLAATVVLLGAQTLALEAMIQVVYPV